MAAMAYWAMGRIVTGRVWQYLRILWIVGYRGDAHFWPQDWPTAEAFMRNEQDAEGARA